LSKILQSNFPDTFAIIYSRAARSIKRWSDNAHGNVRPSTPPRSKIRETTLRDTTGRTYPGLLVFYRRFRNFASRANLMDELSSAADRMQQLIQRQPLSDEARVSMLDVLDKLLYLADGNIVTLGLVGE
jgi:hypothetical protein